MIERVKSEPLSSLKRSLFRVDISRCLEKPDFQKMFIARLLFGDRGPKISGRMLYPEWCLKLGEVIPVLY